MSSVSEGNRGNNIQMESKRDGILIAGLCMHLYLPVGSAMIFMKGTLKQTRQSSSKFKSHSSFGTLDKDNPLALACTGSKPLLS